MPRVSSSTPNTSTKASISVGDTARVGGEEKGLPALRSVATGPALKDGAGWGVVVEVGTERRSPLLRIRDRTGVDPSQRDHR